MDTKAPIEVREAFLAEVARIAASSVFRTSESLCHLLRYLAQHSIDQPETPPKEYQIATEVFGRPADFDSRLDSTVRVQTGRLRSKLTEYYAGPGSEDDLILSIPKGSHSPVFHHRNARSIASPESTPPAPKVTIDASVSPSGRARHFVAPGWSLIVLASALTGLVAYTWWRVRVGPEPGQVSAATRTFWQAFLAKKRLRS